MEKPPTIEYESRHAVKPMAALSWFFTGYFVAGGIAGFPLWTAVWSWKLGPLYLGEAMLFPLVWLGELLGLVIVRILSKARFGTSRELTLGASLGSLVGLPLFLLSYLAIVLSGQYRYVGWP